MRRLVSWLLWFCAGALLLAFILILVVLFVNRKDQPPSKAVLDLQQIAQGNKPVADRDNGYVFVMGFSAPDDADAELAAIERVESIRKFLSSAGPFDYLPAPSHDRESSEKREPDLKKLASLCKDNNRACADTLERDAKRIQDWTDHEARLAMRYQRLLEFGQWRELWPSDLRLPFASFAYVTEAQRLMLLKAWLLAGRGDYVGCKQLLERDLRFWRMTLGESSSMIAKMIAASAIERHFTMGNLVLRRLPASIGLRAMPAEWDEPISVGERSMARVMANEWTFSDRNLRTAAEYGRLLSEDEGSGFNNLAQRLSARLLFQPQATSNASAERMIEVVRLFDREYMDIPRSAETLVGSERFAQKEFTELGVYNFIGELLVNLGDMGSFLKYGYRVADLEGIRRASVLAVQFRSQGLDAADVQDGLRKADLRDPYDGNAFGWDATANAIVFRRTLSGKADLKIAY